MDASLSSSTFRKDECINTSYLRDVAQPACRSPALGRDKIGLLLTEAAGIPVHAVVAPRSSQAPNAVLELLHRAAQRSVLVTFANPGTSEVARRLPRFRRNLLAFDLVLPDGIGMCMAIRFLHGLPACRVSFDMTSLGQAIFAHAQAQGLSIVLVGGVVGVAERARARLVAHFPGLSIPATFHGFGDRATVIREILAIQPDILICGMGTGLQEAFLLEARERGWAGWGFTCGGFLDQLQAGIDYYPRWVDRANLRWAYRVMQEPRRLWRRYLVDYARFGWIVCALRLQHR